MKLVKHGYWIFFNVIILKVARASHADRKPDMQPDSSSSSSRSSDEGETQPAGPAAATREEVVGIPPPPDPAVAVGPLRGVSAQGTKRKWTRRPVCPDDRCRRCWYIECFIPGGPRHTFDGMCMLTC